MNMTRTWKCPDCGKTTEIDYDWLAANGGPICESATATLSSSPKWLMMVVPLRWNDWPTKPTPQDCNQKILMS